MVKQTLFDQLTPVALYGQIKELFPDTVTMLFESVVNNSDGNFSFITIGDMERVTYRDGVTLYKRGEEVESISQDPFSFLQKYYNNIDKDSYDELKLKLGFSFVDGFIGYIGYDMVQLFEPVLEPYMKNLHDNLDSPDLDLVRPSIIIAFSHKNSTLTIVVNDNRYLDRLDDIENTINRAYTPRGLKRAKLYGEGEYSIDEERFKRLVIESKEMIKSGDIFQILISNRYTQKGEIDPLSSIELL